MSLVDVINQDLKSAMKAKDQAALRGIRAIKAALLLAKTDGSGKELDPAAEIKLLQKLVKQRQDSLEIYEKQGREDLAEIEAQEIEVISRYLPKQLSEDELRKQIHSIIKELQATTMSDMGRVMGLAAQRLEGRADGRKISSIVKEELSL